eukprot:9255451-Pyramimonas_sp.AAC.1
MVPKNVSRPMVCVWFESNKVLGAELLIALRVLGSTMTASASPFVYSHATRIIWVSGLKP